METKRLGKLKFLTPFIVLIASAITCICSFISHINGFSFYGRLIVVIIVFKILGDILTFILWKYL